MSDTFMTDFDEFFSCEFTSGGKSELESYLEEPKLPRMGDLNVLEYWKGHQGRFPIVSQMARDILAIPISTVASESVFSVGGRVLDAYRSSLKPETAEVLVCLRDWVSKESSFQPEVEDLCKKVVKLNVNDDDDDDGEKASDISSAQSGF
ncbi:hypothetical protein OROMI_024616 [Orobanche minor]